MKELVRQVDKEVGNEILPIDLEQAIEEYEYQYHHQNKRFKLTDLTVFIRRNVHVNDHADLLGMDQEERDEFYSWGSNSRYKNVFEPILMERFDEIIDRLPDFLPEKEFYFQVRIKIDNIISAPTEKKAREYLKEMFENDYNLDITNEEIILMDKEE